MRGLRTIIFQLATRLKRKLQALLGISTLGPRAIILNEKQQILLVKHTYQSAWYLPGGGVEKGETIRQALLRELSEEVGIIPQEEPQLFGIYFHTYLGTYDYPIIFIVKRFTQEKAYSPEIEQINWFDYHHLPEAISPGTKRRLNEYFNQSMPSEHW